MYVLCQYHPQHSQPAPPPPPNTPSRSSGTLASPLKSRHHFLNPLNKLGVEALILGINFFEAYPPPCVMSSEEDDHPTSSHQRRRLADIFPEIFNSLLALLH